MRQLPLFSRVLGLLALILAIDSPTPGTHTIRIGLFNTVHRAYTVNGARIESTHTILVPANMPASGMSM